MANTTPALNEAHLLRIESGFPRNEASDGIKKEVHRMSVVKKTTTATTKQRQKQTSLLNTNTSATRSLETRRDCRLYAHPVETHPRKKDRGQVAD